MVDFILKKRYSMSDLVDIMAILRSENGCPWDKEQNHRSIRKNMIEEAYEVVEAIDAEDMPLLREELGDVLLQVVFHAQMESERGTFAFEDVADEICKKLIVRHPHIFGEVVADSADEVLKNWDAIKRQTKGQETYAQTLQSVPRVLPALMRAQKIGQRAARAGFDYPGVQMAVGDLKSELSELEAALLAGDDANAFEELGDLLFACTNVARHLHFDAEESLTAASDKFVRRFEQVEQLAEETGVDMKTAGLSELDTLWRHAKQQISNK